MLNFVNGSIYALKQVAEALESFHEPVRQNQLGVRALDRDVRTLKMTVSHDMPVVTPLGQNVRTL